ncbi:Alpha/Beta hydrolase protein [Hypoxylon sp. FL1284]|nr:Alpha/Beta hydrolase protein [Hypoxylon sp. FL1284]
MSSYPEREGEVDFQAPGASKPCKTWYKVVGELTSPPLVVLHGGPGVGYEYMTSLLDLHATHQLPLVFYDQVGCGRSTHFQEKVGDAAFWTMDLFVAELDNLVDHLQLRGTGFSLLGQSWGRHPCCMPLYAEGCRKLLAKMPDDVRSTIEECEAKGAFESPEYQKATGAFYARHFCQLDPFPETLQAGFNNLKQDATPYISLQGPSEFTIVGCFKDWEPWKEAHNIEVETLLLNGEHDEVTDLCVEPWFRSISKVKWVTLSNASHMTHLERPEVFNEHCPEVSLGRLGLGILEEEE